MKKVGNFLWWCFWIPIIFIAMIIDNRAPFGGDTPWLKWLPWGHSPKKKFRIFRKNKP